MKASLGLLFLGTAALAASSVAQNAKTSTAGSASAQTSVPVRRSTVQDRVSASASGSTKVPSKTGKVASSSPLKSGTTIQAELIKPIDAKKSKVGDEVIAKTTQDVKSGAKVVIPTGSRLVGRIMGVRLQNSEQLVSKIGIAFNRAILKSGKEIPVALSIQAIGSNQLAASAATSAKAGPVLSRTSSTRAAMVSASAHHRGTLVTTDHPGAAVNPSFSANSQGVVGLPGISLSSQTTTFATASVISSQDKNVHLDSGTEMILRVNE
jgi:type IV secretory pathway VirB10-like protein